ncbi:MAG: hypothetical protein ACKO96_33645, partial [Flammeovirgaceae bacterium]
VGMLAHLQHIDFFPLLIDLNGLHLTLSDNFYSHFRFCAEMKCEFDLPKLAFAKSSIELVKIYQVGVSNAILYH